MILFYYTLLFFNEKRRSFKESITIPFLYINRLGKRIISRILLYPILDSSSKYYSRPDRKDEGKNKDQTRRG